MSKGKKKLPSNDEGNIKVMNFMVHDSAGQSSSETAEQGEGQSVEGEASSITKEEFDDVKLDLEDAQCTIQCTKEVGTELYDALKAERKRRHWYQLAFRAAVLFAGIFSLIIIITPKWDCSIVRNGQHYAKTFNTIRYADNFETEDYTIKCIMPSNQLMQGSSEADNTGIILAKTGQSYTMDVFVFTPISAPQETIELSLPTTIDYDHTRSIYFQRTNYADCIVTMESIPMIAPDSDVSITNVEFKEMASLTELDDVNQYLQDHGYGPKIMEPTGMQHFVLSFDAVYPDYIVTAKLPHKTSLVFCICTALLMAGFFAFIASVIWWLISKDNPSVDYIKNDVDYEEYFGKKSEES